MESTGIRSAIISTDESFRVLAREVLYHAGQQVTPPVEVRLPFTHVGDEQLRQIREANPELIFLDLEPDPVLGLKFAQFLTDQHPARRIIACGPMLSPDQLLAAIRAGVAEFLPKPVTREALAPAVDALIRRMRSSPNAAPAQPGKLLAIFSPKGGSGSTTVATNLAIHLHRLTGRRTLLVDLDLELGEIALTLGVEPRFHFIDMVRNFHRMDAELLTSFIEHHSSGVHLLSAPYHPEGSELVTGEQLAKIVKFLKQHYDYLIVDTSKSFSPSTLATLEQADEIYLVSTVDLPSLRNIARCLPLLRQISGDDRLRLVLNRHHDDSVIQVKDVERTLGLKVFWTIANDYDAVVQSMNSGVPIVLNGQSRYADDLKALSAEIAGLRGGEPEPAGLERMVSPLRRMWRRVVQEPEVKA